MSDDTLTVNDHFLLVGRAGGGKSTFAANMSPEYLVMDMDGRWAEQNAITGSGKSHIVSNDTLPNMLRRLDALRPGLQGRVRTVVIDSGTSLLDFQQAQDRVTGVKDNARNLAKADTMRALSGAILRWNCSTCWVFHIESNMVSGTAGTRQTISNTELERLKKALNAILEIGKDDKTGIRFARVVWSRYNDGRANNQKVWDVKGKWLGGPQRVNQLIANYTGTEGYNGKCYDEEWLIDFAATEYKAALNPALIKSVLGVDAYPLWFDRNGWKPIVDRLAERAKDLPAIAIPTQEGKK